MSRNGRRHLLVDHPHHLLGRDAVGGHRGDERTGARADVDVELVDGAVDRQQVERAQRADLVDAAGEAAAAEHERGLGATAAPRLAPLAAWPLLRAPSRRRRSSTTLPIRRPLYGGSPAAAATLTRPRLLQTSVRRRSPLLPSLAGCSRRARGPRRQRRRRASRPPRRDPAPPRARTPARTCSIADDAAPHARSPAQADARPRHPASVEKLYTTSTALLPLRPRRHAGHQRVLGRRHAATDGTLGGNLYLSGGGDPTFGCALRAPQLRRRRVGREPGREAARRRHATRAGRHRRRRVAPATRLRGVPDNGLGRVDPYVGPLSAPELRPRPDRGGGSCVAQPAAYAAGKLMGRSRAGRPVAGKATAGPRAAGASALATVSSPTMGTLVALTNRPVRQLLRRDAGQGPGRELRRRRLDGRGRQRGRARPSRATARSPPSSTARASRARDRTSPRDVVRAAQRRARRARPGAASRASLPVAGRTGTLRTRMRGTPARRPLPGQDRHALQRLRPRRLLPTPPRPRLVVFAVLMTNLGLGARPGRQDQYRRDARAARVARAHGQGLRSASRPASSMTSTPRRSAFSSFEPAASPATT